MSVPCGSSSITRAPAASVTPCSRSNTPRSTSDVRSTMNTRASCTARPSSSVTSQRRVAQGWSTRSRISWVASSGTSIRASYSGVKPRRLAENRHGPLEMPTNSNRPNESVETTRAGDASRRRMTDARSASSSRESSTCSIGAPVGSTTRPWSRTPSLPPDTRSARRLASLDASRSRREAGVGSRLGVAWFEESAACAVGAETTFAALPSALGSVRSTVVKRIPPTMTATAIAASLALVLMRTVPTRSGGSTSGRAAPTSASCLG